MVIQLKTFKSEPRKRKGQGSVNMDILNLNHVRPHHSLAYSLATPSPLTCPYSHQQLLSSPPSSTRPHQPPPSTTLASFHHPLPFSLQLENDSSK